MPRSAAERTIRSVSSRISGEQAEAPDGGHGQNRGTRHVRGETEYSTPPRPLTHTQRDGHEIPSFAPPRRGGYRARRHGGPGPILVDDHALPGGVRPRRGGDHVLPLRRSLLHDRGRERVRDGSPVGAPFHGSLVGGGDLRVHPLRHGGDARRPPSSGRPAPRGRRRFSASGHRDRTSPSGTSPGGGDPVHRAVGATDPAVPDRRARSVAKDALVSVPGGCGGSRRPARGGFGGRVRGAAGGAERCGGSDRGWASGRTSGITSTRARRSRGRASATSRSTRSRCRSGSRSRSDRTRYSGIPARRRLARTRATTIGLATKSIPGSYNEQGGPAWHKNDVSGFIDPR